MTARRLHTVRWPPDGTKASAKLYFCMVANKHASSCCSVSIHIIYMYMFTICFCWFYVYQLFVQISLRLHARKQLQKFQQTVHLQWRLCNVRIWEPCWCSKQNLFISHLLDAILPIFISKLLQSICSFKRGMAQISDKCFQTLLKDNMLKHIHWTFRR